MRHRIFPLVFVLLFIANEPTFGARLFRYRHACCPSHVASASSGYGSTLRAPEHFCLQEKIYDDPDSDYDFFACLYYPDGCPDPGETEYYSDFWYGSPTHAYP